MTRITGTDTTEVVNATATGATIIHSIHLTARLGSTLLPTPAITTHGVVTIGITRVITIPLSS